VHYIPGRVNFFLTKKRYKNGDSLGEPRLTWLTHDPGLPQRKEMKKEIESLRSNSLKSNDEIKKKKLKLNWVDLPNQQLWSWNQDDHIEDQKQILNKILNHKKIKQITIKTIKTKSSIKTNEK